MARGSKRESKRGIREGSETGKSVGISKIGKKKEIKNRRDKEIKV